MKTRIIAATDIGNHREQNEDAFAICPDLSHPDWTQSEALVEYGDLGCVLAVADGMGGTNAGEVASACALETLQQQFTPTDVEAAIHDEKHIAELLTKAIVAADEAINKLMLQRPETFGMGTTIVACWLLKDKAYIIWCGDSRCYVYNKKNGLMALTKDHSYVQELVDKGELTEEAAFNHPDNNIITRGLGDFPTRAVPDMVTYNIKPDDIFLLCSDGLSGYCRNKAIEKIIKENQDDLKRCCDQLIQAALKSGAEDNITIALASVNKKPKRRFLFFLF